MNKKLLSIFIIAAFFVAAAPSLAFDFETGSGVNQTGEKAGYAEEGLTTMTLTEIIGAVIKTALLWLGIFFFILCIYAGLTWMLSRGNTQAIDKAKATLQNAIIGLAVIVCSYVITFFIMDILTG